MMDKNEIILSAYICIRRYREGGLPEVGDQVDGLLDVMAEKIAKDNGEDVQDAIDDVSNMLALERKMIALETKRLKRDVESHLPMLRRINNHKMSEAESHEIWRSINFGEIWADLEKGDKN